MHERVYVRACVFVCASSWDEVGWRSENVLNVCWHAQRPNTVERNEPNPVKELRLGRKWSCLSDFAVSEISFHLSILPSLLLILFTLPHQRVQNRRESVAYPVLKRMWTRKKRWENLSLPPFSSSLSSFHVDIPTHLGTHPPEGGPSLHILLMSNYQQSPLISRFRRSQSIVHLSCQYRSRKNILWNNSFNFASKVIKYQIFWNFLLKF